MPALLPTEFTAETTWIGRVGDREATLNSEPLQSVEMTWAGIAGEHHGGVTKGSCVRMRAQHPEGTEIRNVRQLTILSAEELDLTAADMGLETLDPALTGASLVLRGIPDFTHVPPGSRLQNQHGTTLVVDMENRPCTLPARGIENAHSGAGKLFKPAAKGRRGVTAWVERPGPWSLGDTVTLHIPDQRAWAHIAAVSDKR